MVTFLFFVHTITKAKQYAGLSKAEPGLKLGRYVDLPARSFDLARPGVVPPLGIWSFETRDVVLRYGAKQISISRTIWA